MTEASRWAGDSMLSDGEQKKLAQIGKYLDAGHSIEAIVDAGWVEWIDYFASKGISLDDTQPPVEEQAPADDPVGEAEPKFTMLLARHYLGTQVETDGTDSERKFVRMGPMFTTGTFLFETGAVLGRAMRDRLATFTYPFCSETPDNAELADFIRVQGQAVASAAPEANTIYELVAISEMRKADPSLPAEQWNAWLLENVDAEVTVEFAGRMALVFQSNGAGFGAEFPERFEELFAASSQADDPEQVSEAAAVGPVAPAQTPAYDSLETRTKAELTMFAEYCAEFYPDYVARLGLSQYISDTAH